MKGDSLIKRYYVGIGKNPDGKTKVREGDNRTPEGNFKYLRPEPSSNWEFNGEKVYGPWFLRLETEPFKGIGIHGTDTVDVIGTRCTRGCIRMYNESITELKEILPVGSMVNIYRSFIKNKR
jgi:lipoprotein-anchoring transpeptidase ErfK/SrfK